MAKLTDRKKRNGIDWGIDTTGFGWEKIGDMPTGQPFYVLGAFIIKDNGYGRTPVIIVTDDNGNGSFVYLPARYMEEIEGVLSDGDGIQQIKDGCVIVTFNEYVIKKGARAGQTCIIADFTAK